MTTLLTRTSRWLQMAFYACAVAPYALALACAWLACAFYHAHGVWLTSDMGAKWPTFHQHAYSGVLLGLLAAQFMVFPASPFLLWLFTRGGQRPLAPPLAFFLGGLLLLLVTFASDFFAWMME